ncbi:hypothetical protein BDY24DRAFT_281056 [Mrakia frigida]|uniref:uncharacterized protein n=1 Tax=Mrakia frigida TaxID=29902 RepID=UPI003FCC22A5
MSSLLSLSSHLQTLLLSPSPILGFAWMDVLGVPRLSFVLDQVFRGVNQGEKEGRPGFGSELLTILTLVFGGETLLSLLHPSSPPPSWLLSPTPLLLFGSVHLLVTQTPLQRLIPKRSHVLFELAMAPLDALGRTLGLCAFVVDGLMGREGLGKGENWWMVVVMSWIGMYGGGLLVNLFNMFSISWKFQTPPEFKPYGWLTQDFWIPPVFTTLYLYLLSPQPLFFSPSTHSFLFTYPLSSLFFSDQNDNQTQRSYLFPPPTKPIYLLSAAAWSKEDARALVGVLISALFVMRTVWSYREEVVGFGKGMGRGRKVVAGKKIKTQ